MGIANLIRIIKNLISIGTVVQIDSKKALAKVNILERETDFFPVLSISNSYKRKFTPIKIGEQVLVLCPNGNADFGIIIPSIFNKGSNEPDGSNENIEIETYSDGTTISYDTSSKELKIDASNKITIICKSAKTKADTVVITADTTNNGDVEINGNLTVSSDVAINGNLTVSSDVEISGNLTANDDVKINGNLTVNGTIADSKGDLTSHTHGGITTPR